MKVALPALACIALPLTACVNERVYVDPSQAPTVDADWGAEPATLNVFSGSLRGDFGPRRGFDGEATSVNAHSDPTFVSSVVDVARVEQGKGMGMVILYTSGILLEDLELGSHTFHFDPNSLDLPPVGANVCSGTEDGTIDYDLPADSVVVNVSVTPEGRTYDVSTVTSTIDPMTGEFTGEVETSDVSFVLGAAR